MSKPSGTNPNQGMAVAYTPTQGNDKGAELVNLVDTWWRANKFGVTSTERTNIATAVSNILATGL